MRAFYISLLIPLGISGMVHAQNGSQTNNIVMKDGVFWAAEEVAGKVFVYGSWVQPTFNVNDHKAISKAILQIASLRGNPTDYTIQIASLNAALQFTKENGNLQALNINKTLQQELAYALATGKNLSADWSKVSLKGMDLGADEPFYDADKETTYNPAENPARDFSGTNITGTQLNTLPSLKFLTLSNLDLKGFNPSGKDISNTNFSGAANLDFSKVNKATSLAGTNLSELDVSQLDLSGKTLTPGINLSNTNITPTQITKATGFNSYGNTIFQATDLQGTGITKEALASEFRKANKDPYGPEININFRFIFD